MTLAIGTNCGFVTVAPTSDPERTALTISGRGQVVRDTSSATAVKITEIGWWCSNSTTEANFEVGLYAADGGSGEAGTLLHVSRTNAKGTTDGWKRVTGLDWTISSSTTYWIGVQLDGTGPATTVDYSIGGGSGSDYKFSLSTLPNPFGAGSFDDDGVTAIYAVWEAAAATGTNTKINIGDTFKDVSEMKINIGDTWKAVAEVKQNVGDAWKTVF